MIDLAGLWTLADAEGGRSLPTTVPGEMQSARFAAGRRSDDAIARHTCGKPLGFRFTPADADPSAVRLTPRDLWSSAQPPIRGTS